MFSARDLPALNDNDKAWLLEQLGQAVAALAYAASPEIGAQTVANLDGLPEYARLSVSVRPAEE